jgi:hypothetical protein
MWHAYIFAKLRQALKTPATIQGEPMNSASAFSMAPTSERRPAIAGILLSVLALTGLLLSTSCLAQTCSSPSASHPTLQQAVDDPNCSTVLLAALSYPEFLQIARSLTLVGTGSGNSTIDGPVAISGATTQVSLNSLGVRNGCAIPGLQVSGGARVSTADVAIAPAAIFCAGLPNLLFEDGFEVEADLIF